MSACAPAWAKHRAPGFSTLRYIAIALLAVAVPSSVAAAAQDQGAGADTGDASSAQVRFETTMGEFVVTLFPGDAPLTVANFLSYVDQGHYDGTLFHRVIPGFMIQGGGFDRALNLKPTFPPIANESGNGLQNVIGTIAMARTSDPDSATSQFFINLASNENLDARGSRPGYAVFGRISDGMEVVNKIARVPTGTLGQFRNIPEDDVVILSARRVGAAVGAAAGQSFTAGEDFVLLDKPVATRDPERIEVVGAFSYGCPYCYQLEPYVQVWRQRQPDDVDFQQFHAAWNDSMRLYAQVFLTARHLDVLDRIHVPLFNALQSEQRSLRSPGEMAGFFETFGVERGEFVAAFRSPEVRDALVDAERQVSGYELSGVPQFVVNGKYRVDPVRAQGRQRMLDVVDFLVRREREAGSASNREDSGSE